MSAVLFNLVIDLVMQRTTEDQPRGIRWMLFDTLENLGFADDVVLLSHMHRLMQEKTRCLSKFGQQAELQISKRKTEIMTWNVNAPALGPYKHRDLYLSGQNCQTGWRYQRGHSEQTEQSQERL